MGSVRDGRFLFYVLFLDEQRIIYYNGKRVTGVVKRAMKTWNRRLDERRQ